MGGGGRLPPHGRTKYKYTLKSRQYPKEIYAKEFYDNHNSDTRRAPSQPTTKLVARSNMNTCS